MYDFEAVLKIYKASSGRRKIGGGGHGGSYMTRDGAGHVKTGID